MSGFERFRGNIQRIRQLTAPIKITDIMVAPFAPKTTGNYLGEFAISGTNTNEGHQGDLKTRIGDHIEHLALMANKEHEKANFTDNSGKFNINPGSENNVTRLSTHEFSFYPKDRPLTLDEYRALLVRIREIAGNCHENLHLLLASFPVKWPDNKVYNIVVHVQCGKEPILSPFAKSVPSSIDALYPNTSNPSFVGTSFYPKVLSGRYGIKLRFKIKASKFDDVVKWITDGTFNKTRSIQALEDTKQALLADKHCPPPISLISCIDDSILALNTYGILNPTEKENFTKAMNNFKTTMIEESDRFDDAANLAPPRPYIISNGVATNHYGRLSFQQIIDFINKCDGDNSQNDKATEILETTKQYIEQGRTANPDYPINPKLIVQIDNMILKIKGTTVALDNSDITEFKRRMNKYYDKCQEIYQDNSLKTQRPDIISSELESSLGDIPFNQIAQEVKNNSLPSNYADGETLLTELKANIEDYNNDNSHYAPDSTNLIAHIDMMLLKYSPFAPLPNTDFTDLDAKLKQYKINCETRYSNYVRSIMPQISSQIGNTASYAEENNLDKIARLVKDNLDQPNLIRSSRNQLDYLRNYLLFSNNEKSKGTKHALLQTIENISEKLDNLIFVDQLQKEHKVHKDIGTILIKPLLQIEDITQIHQCLKEVQNAILTLKRIYPAENVAIKEIEEKISELADVYNADDLNSIILKRKELDAFKEGYDALSVLLNKLPIDYAIQPSDSDKLKLEIETYNTEDLGEKIENSIKNINKLITENIDFQAEYAHLSRIFAYINYIENLPPECKKAMSAIKVKLDNKQQVDISLIQELKNQLTLQKSLIEKMPYWNFPTQTLSQDIIYDTTVQCRTNNSEWWTNTSVCLDELFAIGYRSYLNALAGEAEPPMYGSEMITSDSVGIEQSHSINPQGIVSHVDVTTYEDQGSTTVTKKSSTELSDTLMGTRDLATGHTLGLNQMDHAKTVSPKTSNINYTTTVDSTDTDQLVIDNPIFGPKIVVRMYDNHTLHPLPISSNNAASIDTYTANYYVRRLDAILKSFNLPKDAVKQREYLNDYLVKLDKLKNNHAATVSDFYRLLKELETKVKLIPSSEENNEKCMHQIALMRHFMDTKMISVESYIMFRCLDQIEGPLSIEQQKIVDEFKDDLKIIQNKVVTFDPSTGFPIIPANELTQAVFDFRNKITVAAALGQDVTKLLGAYEQAKEYLRGQYPEIYSVLVRKRFPEFAKVLDLVEPLGSGLTEKQLSAVKALQQALRDIQMQSLHFDTKGRPILETYDLEKALENFNLHIKSISGEDINGLKLLSENIDKHIKQLQIEFKSLNLGKEYYDKQLDAIEERQKHIKREINSHESSKSQSSLEIGKKWQYRDPTTQSLESDMQEKLNNYLKTTEVSELNEQSYPRVAVKQLIDALEYIKKATGTKSNKSVVMTDELIKLMINFKKTIDVIPFPSLQTVYKELLVDLKKNHPDIYQSLMTAISRDQLSEQHQKLPLTVKELELKLQNAKSQQILLDKIESDLLPNTKKEYMSKKLECETVKEELDKETNQLSVDLENKDNASRKLEELLTQQKLQHEEIDSLKRNNEQFTSEKDELQSKLIKLNSFKETIANFSELNQKIILNTELLQQNNEKQILLRLSQGEIESKLQTLPNKFPDLRRRSSELKDVLKSDVDSLADRVNRLRLLGEVTEKNQQDAIKLQNEIGDYQRRIDLSRSEISKIEDKILIISKDIDELEQQHSEQSKSIKLLEFENSKLTEELRLSNIQQGLNQNKINDLSQDLFNQEKQQSPQDITTTLFDKVSREIIQTEEIMLDIQNKISEHDEMISHKKLSVNKLDEPIEEAHMKLQKMHEKEQQQSLTVKEITLKFESYSMAVNDLEQKVQSLDLEKDKITKDLSGDTTSIKYFSEQIEKTRGQSEAVDNQIAKHKEQQNELGQKTVKPQLEKQDLDEKHESYTQRRQGL